MVDIRRSQGGSIVELGAFLFFLSRHLEDGRVYELIDIAYLMMRSPASGHRRQVWISVRNLRFCLLFVDKWLGALFHDICGTYWQAIIIMQGVIHVHDVVERVRKLIQLISRLEVVRIHWIMRFLLDQVSEVLIISTVSVSRRRLVADTLPK